jgi:hypothetical protein
MTDANVDPYKSKDTIDWIMSNKKALTTQKNYLCSVQYWLRGHADVEEICKEYRKKIKELADLITEGYKTQELTEREAKKYETWDVICDWSDKLLADVSVLDTDKIMVGLYTLLPPVRLDYCNLRLFDKKPEEDKGNYAVINKEEAYVRLNEHKTAKTYGALQMTLPKKLARRIRLFMKANPEVRVLFEMNEKAFGKRLARIFAKYTDKHIGVCVLRHSYISSFLDKAPSLKKCEALAKMMGHSTTLQQYYRRLRKEGDISSSESDTESDAE